MRGKVGRSWGLLPVAYIFTAKTREAKGRMRQAAPFPGHVLLVDHPCDWLMSSVLTPATARFQWRPQLLANRQMDCQHLCGGSKVQPMDSLTHNAKFLRTQ